MIFWIFENYADIFSKNSEFVILMKIRKFQNYIDWLCGYLLYEFPRGNQVDGLPRVSNIDVFEKLKFRI